MKVIVLGNGGHSKVIQEILTILNHEIIAILDDKYNEPVQKKGIIYGPLSFVNSLLDTHTKVVIGIGDNNSRKQVSESINLSTEKYLTVVHPTAVVSSSAIIDNGTVIMPKAVINANTKIGVHCIINTGAIIEHDNSINNYIHVSPNATLTGNVSLGEGVHVGASATLIPGIIVGHWSIIGAGSTVINHIPPYKKAVGCPARILLK